MVIVMAGCSSVAAEGGVGRQVGPVLAPLQGLRRRGPFGPEGAAGEAAGAGLEAASKDPKSC